MSTVVSLKPDSAVTAANQVKLIRHLLAQQAFDHSGQYTFNKACCYGSLTAQIIASSSTPRSYDNITKLIYLMAQDHLDLTPIMSNEDPIYNPDRSVIRVLIHGLDHDRLNRAILTQGLDLDELESKRYLWDDLGQFQSNNLAELLEELDVTEKSGYEPRNN